MWVFWLDGSSWWLIKHQTNLGAHFLTFCPRAPSPYHGPKPWHEPRPITCAWPPGPGWLLLVACCPWGVYIIIYTEIYIERERVMYWMFCIYMCWEYIHTVYIESDVFVATYWIAYIKYDIICQLYCPCYWSLVGPIGYCLHFSHLLAHRCHSGLPLRSAR